MDNPRESKVICNVSFIVCDNMHICQCILRVNVESIVEYSVLLEIAAGKHANTHIYRYVHIYTRVAVHIVQLSSTQKEQNEIGMTSVYI